MSRREVVRVFCESFATCPNSTLPETCEQNASLESVNKAQKEKMKRRDPSMDCNRTISSRLKSLQNASIL